MCHWGVNKNPWADYRMGPSATPTPRLTPQTGGQEVPLLNCSKIGDHRFSTSCGVVITIVVMTLFFVSGQNISSTHCRSLCRTCREQTCSAITQNDQDKYFNKYYHCSNKTIPHTQQQALILNDTRLMTTQDD